MGKETFYACVRTLLIFSLGGPAIGYFLFFSWALLMDPGQRFFVVPIAFVLMAPLSFVFGAPSAVAAGVVAALAYPVIKPTWLYVLLCAACGLTITRLLLEAGAVFGCLAALACGAFARVPIDVIVAPFKAQPKTG